MVPARFIPDAKLATAPAVLDIAQRGPVHIGLVGADDGTVITDVDSGNGDGAGHVHDMLIFIAQFEPLDCNRKIPAERLVGADQRVRPINAGDGREATREIRRQRREAAILIQEIRHRIGVQAIAHDGAVVGNAGAANCGLSGHVKGYKRAGRGRERQHQPGAARGGGSTDHQRNSRYDIFTQ